MIDVAFNNRQQVLEIDASRLVAAVQRVLLEAGIELAEVSLATVDDAEIHTLNAKYLNHDWPTDVLSFLHEHEGNQLDGEVIVSTETAIRQARQYDCQPQDELLLYVIHGSLHLVGFDDHDDQDIQRMREAERRHLEHFGVTIAPHESAIQQRESPQ